MKPLQFSLKDLLLITTIFALAWGWFVESRVRHIAPTDVQKAYAEYARLMARKTSLEWETKELEAGIEDLQRSTRVTKQRLDELEVEFYKIRDKVGESEFKHAK